MRALPSALLVVLAAMSCQAGFGGGQGVPPPGPGTQGDNAADDETPTDDDSKGEETPADDDSTTADDDTRPDDDTVKPDPTPEPTPEPTPTPTPVRFIALGDTGEGNTAQSEVAAVMADVCASDGCDFILLLGDNIYDAGVSGTDDTQWLEKFEIPYAPVPAVFYPVIGNHDYGDILDGSGLAVWQGAYEVDYSALSDKWEMPATWYAHTHGFADFYALDTATIFYTGLFSSDVDAQAAWLESSWTQTPAGRWRIAYGHHPYLSNGPHGNAGNYEGLPDFIPFAAGTEIKEFLEDHVCGEADLYLCGHDHSRQWLEASCSGTGLLVSGAGSKTSELGGSEPTWFEDSSQEGFVWIELRATDMTVRWWDRTGTMNHEQVVPKPLP